MVSVVDLMLLLFDMIGYQCLVETESLKEVAYMVDRLLALGVVASTDCFLCQGELKVILIWKYFLMKKGLQRAAYSLLMELQ